MIMGANSNPSWCCLLDKYSLAYLLKNFDKEVIRWNNLKPSTYFPLVDFDIGGIYNSFEKVSSELSPVFLKQFTLHT